MQFGSKPLFENVSVKFNNGNRYGLIGANGCGKSTFMKILGGDLEPSGGQVMLEPNTRLGKLRQDQFAYEEFTVIDTVIMGHGQLWKVKAERDRIYSLPEMTEEDGIRDPEMSRGLGDVYKRQPPLISPCSSAPSRCSKTFLSNSTTATATVSYTHLTLPTNSRV